MAIGTIGALGLYAQDLVDQVEKPGIEHVSNQNMEEILVMEIVRHLITYQ